MSLRQATGADILVQGSYVVLNQRPDASLRLMVRAFDAHSAQSLFERALAADPKFALAHLGLADVWSELGFRQRASQEAAEAYKLSTNLPRAEQLAVEADDRKFSNDKAIRLYQSMVGFYPDDPAWAFKLAAIQQEDGRQKEALHTLEQLRKRLSPRGIWLIEHLPSALALYTCTGDALSSECLGHASGAHSSAQAADDPLHPPARRGLRARGRGLAGRS